MKTKNIFIFAGEPSGDLHGRKLLKSLKVALPDFEFWGVAGPEMRPGMECLLMTEDFSVMGFTDVFLSLPKLIRNYFRIKKSILSNHPAAVVLIDYPGFNLRLAKSLRKAGYQGKIIHYICPTVWAWGKKRISHMAKTLDLLLTIYPFEKSYFENMGLDVRYVGNPLVENLEEHIYSKDWLKQFELPGRGDIIAVFPGSRVGEIKRNLPKQLEALKKIRIAYPNVQIALSCAHPELAPYIEHALQKVSLKANQDVFLIPKKFSYDLMRDCRCAIAKSGTVTLELALHQTPTAVVYELSFVNWFIAKYIVRLNLPFYCIVNILGGREIFPEMIAEGFTVKNLTERFSKLFENSSEREGCLVACREIREQLEMVNGSEKAAHAIQELLQC